MANTVMIQQFYLACLGYDPGKIDGILGKRTEAAIIKFIKDNTDKFKLLLTDSIPFRINLIAKEKLPRHLIVAAQYLGEKEIADVNTNPLIPRMWKALGLNIYEDSTPWCSAFEAKIIVDRKYPGIDAQYLKEIGINAKARSWEKWQFPSTGYLGDIAVFSRGNPKSGKGHVGNVVGVNEDGDLWILGGNQGNSVSVTLIERKRLICFKKPFPDSQRIPLPLITAKAPLSTNEA